MLTAPRCHASERTGTRVPVEEVGTDRERLKTWSKQAAIESNKVVRNFGIERRGLVENEPSGYIAAFPGRHLAARALSAQRFGADFARFAQAGRRAAKGILSRL